MMYIIMSPYPQCWTGVLVLLNLPADSGHLGVKLTALQGSELKPEQSLAQPLYGTCNRVGCKRYTVNPFSPSAFFLRPSNLIHPPPCTTLFFPPIDCREYGGRE